MAIWEADEPIHRRSYQGAHEQLASHRVRAPNQHHLGMEGREVSLWVLCTREGGFRAHERSWYHNVHYRLRKRHWELPGWRRGFLFFHLTFPCLVLQIPVQLLIGSAQFFICCPRRLQISLNALLIRSRHNHQFLEGLHRIHNLLQGEGFAVVRCNRSLSSISHLLNLSGSCWWDSVLNRVSRWAPNVHAG